MLDLVKAAARIQTILDKQHWDFCFIGGVAVQKWGQVRVTNDIDLTIFTGFGGEERFIDQLLKSFSARIPNAKKFAIQSRVLLLVTQNGIEIDVSFGGLSFENSVIARSKKVQLRKGIRLRLCTAEDLIIYKAFANRPIDWMDIEGILAKQQTEKLDWAYILTHLPGLAKLKEEPEILTRLGRLRREV